MAHVQSRKSNFYSQKQSIRDELSAPLYLESAGDLLIKQLARKQTNTRTSLQEQLQIVQNFEKGFHLNPDNRGGLASLGEFQKHALEHSDPATPDNTEKQLIPRLDEIMKDAALTRHELELGLCEKPNSAASQLYMFAIGNKRRHPHSDTLTGKCHQHPINRLKEIQEECFGQAKKPQQSQAAPPEEKPKKKRGRNNKHRKRRRKPSKTPAEGPGGNPPPEPQPPEAPVPCQQNQHPRTPCPRPSLWDVKDMKKWAESPQIGCTPPALYTIRNGKIIKLGEGSGVQDVT